MASYENPAKLFLKNHSIESLTDVIAYTNFLREESGITSEPPIDLQIIMNRFSINRPETVQLPKQQGTTVTFNGSPQIIIHAGDIVTRQKFSTAHELIELLFSELPGNIRPDRVKENIFGKDKEQICQMAAANLIMPEQSFRPRSTRLGLAFKSAETLAEEYEVSLMAALSRLVDMYPNQSIMVLWQIKNKPAELKNKIPENQIKLPGLLPNNLPMKKIRVSWTHGRYKNYFLPLNKSIPEDSSIYNAWNTDQFVSGEEIIPFGSYNVKVFVESKPVNIKGEKHILSLIR